jgi:hypothetical protein
MGHVTHMMEINNTCNVLFEKPQITGLFELNRRGVITEFI